MNGYSVSSAQCQERAATGWLTRFYAHNAISSLEEIKISPRFARQLAWTKSLAADLPQIAGNFSEFETLTIFATKKVICSGHAHAFAAMHHIVRATSFCKLD